MDENPTPQQEDSAGPPTGQERVTIPSKFEVWVWHGGASKKVCVAIEDTFAAAANILSSAMNTGVISPDPAGVKRWTWWKPARGEVLERVHLPEHLAPRE